MTYLNSHSGVRVWDRTPCPRCGVERVTNAGPVLCRDCRGVLSPSEREAWK